MEKIFIVFMFSLFMCGRNCENDYVLNTPKCKIPAIEPFNEDVVNIIKPLRYLPCSMYELPTYVEKNKDGSSVLHVRENLLVRDASENVSCCYSYITRNGSPTQPDVGFKTSECQYFKKNTVLAQDTVKVTCTNNASKQIYENVHNTIIIKDSLKKKIKNHTSKSFSVLFVVIDSVSRLNFIRTMPQTYKFLSENNFIEMKGYTKVADNTFPNCVSLLTGLNSTETFKNCKAKEVGGMDLCPMIWHDFRNEGYVTAYAEDMANINTFNYLKKGFTNPPTDYYFKPYIEATEKLGVRYYNEMAYCTGPEVAGERILNLARDFVTTFKNQTTFGIFWMNSFSHNAVNSPFAMDGKVKKFFVDLKKKGILDDSIVIMLSDHGVRFGEIRTTKSGWFEERTPINMISVPKSFQEKFETQYQNLRNNSNKLTSTYDLFVTLEDVLTLSETSYKKKGSSACQKCVSLFEEIPEERSCEDAGIPPEWCTCGGQFRTLNANDEYVKNVTTLALEKINRCKLVSLHKVLSASMSESLSVDTKYLFVSFETQPSEIFLTTVKFKQIVTSEAAFFIRSITTLDLCVQASY